MGVDLVGFRRVHGGISRRIDNQVWTDISNGSANTAGIEEIELLAIRRNDLAECRQKAMKLESDLAIFPRQQDRGLHLERYLGKFSGGMSRSLGFLRSRSESTGSDLPHEIATSGSFQRMAYSSAGA